MSRRVWRCRESSWKTCVGQEEGSEVHGELASPSPHPLQLLHDSKTDKGFRLTGFSKNPKILIADKNSSR